MMAIEALSEDFGVIQQAMVSADIREWDAEPPTTRTTLQEQASTVPLEQDSTEALGTSPEVLQQASTKAQEASLAAP